MNTCAADAGLPCVQYSVATALQSRFANDSSVSIAVAAGCSSTRCPDTKQVPQALSAAADADLIVFVMGLDGKIEGEGFDRVAYPCNGVDSSVFGLPGCQYQLITDVTKSLSASQTAVLVLMHGGGVATPAEAVNPAIGELPLLVLGDCHCLRACVESPPLLQARFWTRSTVVHWAPSPSLTRCLATTSLVARYAVAILRR